MFPVPTGMCVSPSGRRRPGPRRRRTARRCRSRRSAVRPDARRRVAPRRTGHPVVEVAGRQRDVARRAGRPARRVDADDLARLRAKVRAEGVVRRARRPQLVLLGERQLGDVGQAAREPREPVAVERRALAEVGDLGAEGRVVERELLLPRSSLDVSARTRPPPRRPPPARARSGAPAPRPDARAGRRCARGSARPSPTWREPEVEQDRGDRQRDVHRQRLAPDLVDGVAEGARASATFGPLTPARRRARGSVRRAGRAACAPDGRSREPCRRRRGSRARPPRALRPDAEQPGALLRGAEDDGPAAEDPGGDGALQRAGSAANVIRAATFVGISPCSAIETSSRSRK